MANVGILCLGFVGGDIEDVVLLQIVVRARDNVAPVEVDVDYLALSVAVLAINESGKVNNMAICSAMDGKMDYGYKK